MDFYRLRQLDDVSVRQARALGKQFAEWLNMTGGTKLVFHLLRLEQQIRHLNEEHATYCANLTGDKSYGDDVSDKMST